ncbi:FdhF/YdeP family oxidoreductase [Streptomyces caelestis]|jgi:molybdopterin-dependent oxidoreductase alpha subunit|uniref:Molybdopterin-dependent oxidoreductase alpha subunit n=1 Tax=Streptomyces caelestis TaxID=36816 RepID=A0A7W9HCS5_9ACTN|nr:FdhF/YdeP family oxidoreductase [Streptomyces caelestis]MBB5799584.1 molybdopterin-dependent oxidoreductase alpha subunit [Streptomyces caelestis]GGW80893.1 formate dehydrogenase [Streptomyces caelestis]
MTRKAPAEDPGDSRLRVGPPKDHAAGVPAVMSSLRHAHAQMGVRRSLLTLLSVNQKTGFDCPGCAWPEPEHRHRAEFCENGAKAVAEEATLRRVGPGFFAEHTLAELAGRSDYWLGQQGRLTHPMYRAAGSDRYRQISWDEAFAVIARELGALDSPDQAAFYTSGRASNEAAFVYQLFVRLLGTNNLPDCSNMCHESSGSALTETIGIGKGSVRLEDLYEADLILVVGQNPGTNHPRMLSALETAKGRGARVISVNPLPEAGLSRFRNPQRPSGVLGAGTQLSDRFLQIRLGGDQALFQAFNRMLLEAEDDAPGTVLDRDFIAAHTHGFEEFADQARKTSWDDVLEATGLSEREIREAFQEVVSARKIVVCWAMGLTQHRHSVPTIREVVNFLLLRGNIGRPGAGLCPVRGHSNVQGDRTMGIHEKPDAAFLDALGAEFGFVPPRHHGHDAVESIRAMRDGQVRVFVALGGNFVSAAPDTELTERALRNCELTVQISTKPNRSHAVTGRQALILPCLGRTEADLRPAGEQRVTVEDSMGMVHLSRGRLAPASDALLSEVAIICRMANAALDSGGPQVPWADFEADYDLIRDRIARVIPGFEDFNARVRRPGGFALPHPPRDERRFPTRTGLANFTVNPLEVLRVPRGRLLLQTLRSHDQYNTTIYGLDDRYRGIHQGRRVLFVHPDDLAARGLTEGDPVDIVSEFSDGVERRAPAFRTVAYPTPRGCCAAYFPETNVLVPLDSTAEVSNTPTSKSIVVRLEPAH